MGARGPAVSVVLSVYNMARYLDETMASILGQTLSDLEVICVNDGSTDSSLDILERYAGADERVVVVDQINAGQSAARNAGWARARGRYILHMDADDILEPEALATLVARCDDDDLDLLRFNMTAFPDTPDMVATAEGEMRRWRVRTATEGTVTGGELLEMLVAEGSYSPVTWLYLIRAEVVSVRDSAFAPVRYHEDAIFTPHAFLAARRTASVTDSLIRRRVRAGSQGKGSRANGDLSDRLYMLRDLSELAASERTAGRPVHFAPHVVARLSQVPTAWRILGDSAARSAVAERAENAVLAPALAELVRIDDRTAKARDRVERAVARNRAIERNPVLHAVAKAMGAIARRSGRVG